MAIGDDFSVDSLGNIRHIDGATDTYTVLELHRWLQDLADDAAASGDDLIDITSSTPSERSTDNIITLNSPYNIDDTAAQFLYDGSISQNDGDTLYSGLVIVGAVNNAATVLQVVQNNQLYDGADPFWGTGLNADPANNILSRMIIKTRDAGADIDGKRIRIYARELGDTYAEFSVTMGLGNSTAAIFTNVDLNNQTDATTISGWTTIANTEGYQLIDLGNGAGARPYYSQWTRDTYTINQLYEWTKYATMRGSTETLYGLSGELFRGITHEFAYDTGSGTFTQNEILSWGTDTTAGTGALLAIEDNSGTGTIWFQLLTGVAPTDTMTITGGTSGATCAVSGTVTSHSVPQTILGTSTGSSIIGAFGVGITANDLTKDDKLFDLTNTQQIPPNIVTFTVSGVVTDEDRVLVGTKDDVENNFKFDQLSLSGAHVSTDTTVTVTTTIPSDTPAAGTIRVLGTDLVYHRVEYTSWSDTVFTLAAELGFDADDAANVWISYIDELADATSISFTTIYSADRSLYVRVRDGGTSPIKTFETPSTLTNAGGSITAIRTSDA